MAWHGSVRRHGNPQPNAFFTESPQRLFRSMLAGTTAAKRRMIRSGTLAAATLLLFCALAASAAPTPKAGAGLEKATFAGGCFWCMEPPYIELPGVSGVTVGYTGGGKTDPTYEQVSAGGTGHAEAIEIVYDPAKVTYAQLLDIFWHNVDPTAKDRQFCDGGNQYRTAIFTNSPDQQRAAEQSKAKLQQDPRFAGKTLYTEVVPAGPFYAAEDYHQHYFRKNATSYKFYRWNCGRDQRLRAIWGAAPAH